MQALAASHPDIVPADVLALEAGRGLRAAECATLLDGWLRRLARQEARARRVLGRLARGFLRRHHHHDLGFARLRDYTRERLGLSARELQSLAHVVEGLARLPAIGDAFDNGEITWSQARCHAAEAIAAEGHSARGVEPEDPLAGLPDPAPAPVLEEEGRLPLRALDWSAVQEALPEDVEALARGAEDLNAFGLDRRMRAALRALQRVDFQMGRLLHLLFARRLYRLLGFPTAARYAEERLGLSARKARALVALDRCSAALPALAAAYRQGEVSWLRALSLLPVVDEGSAAAWVARAQAVTIRRLVDEVEWTLAVHDTGGKAAGPPPLGARLVRPERQVCAHAARRRHLGARHAARTARARDAAGRPLPGGVRADGVAGYNVRATRYSPSRRRGPDEDTVLASPGRSCYRCIEWRSRCDCARSCSARPSAPGRSRWRW